MLFDLERDPLEVNNLAAQPSMEGVRRQLEAHLDEWSAKTPWRAKELSAPNALRPRAPRTLPRVPRSQ
jgi:hypothetical protein